MAATFSVYRKIEKSPNVATRGQVVTKPHIVELILDLAGYRGQAGRRLLDPGCGEGAFAVAAAARLIRANGIPKEVEHLADRIVAIDTDATLVGTCRQRLREELVSRGATQAVASELAKRWTVVGDFLEHEFSHLFDFVFGNPPYVRQEALAEGRLEGYRAKFECFFDRADLYIAFFERGLKLLAERGVLALICPDRFTRNNYGKKLRGLISRFQVRCVVDLAHASPFEPEVTCYPGIFVVANRPHQGPVDFFRLTSASPEECRAVRRRAAATGVTHHRYATWFGGEERWSAESPQHLTLLRQLESSCVPLGQEASGCRVGIGVATGADDVFIVDEDFDEVERELLMPLVMTNDINTGTVVWRGKCVINPFLGNSPRLIALGQHPKAKAYFQRHRPQLLGRNVAQRKPREWYRTIDRIYPQLRTRPKLLIPDIKSHNLIVWEEGRLYPHHNLYYVVSDYWDLRALRAILRSSVGRFFVWMYGVKMRGDFLRFRAQYLRRNCVPRLMAISGRVAKRLRTVDASPDADEVDQVVAEAYRLTHRELELARSVAAPRKR